jgi:hypothetical protein
MGRHYYNNSIGRTIMITYKLMINYDRVDQSSPPDRVMKTDVTGQKYIIPFDPKNIDYQEYLNWLTEGNIPEPADETKPDYRAQRAAEYPSIGDQLDALFHAGMLPRELTIQIQAVKAKYPKV